MKSKSTFPTFLTVAGMIAVLGVCSIHFASAASGTWNVDSSTTWATAGSWDSSIVASDSSSTANFTNDITADRTVTLSADTTINSIIFSDSDTATAGSWILAHNGTSTNNLILAGTTPTVTVNALGTGKTATISAIIEGTAGLVKNGSGILILSGANTYTGGTNISAGTLQLNTGGSLSSGAVTGTGNFINTISYTPANVWSAFAGTYTHNTTTASSVFNSADATSQSAAYNIASQQGSIQGIIAAANGDYTLKMGSLAGVANSMIRGGGFVTGTTTFEIGNLNTNTTFAGIIRNGTAASNPKIIAFTKVGNGIQILSGVNLYTGITTISAGTLQIGSGAAAGSISNSSAIINNASLVFSSTAAQSSAHAISGTGSLTKAEAGTLTMTGANTYTGATAVNAGTLSLTGSLTSNISAASGATITGTGSTTGSLTANAGSSLVAKSAGGVLTASGGVNFAGATSLVFDDVLISGNTYDVVNYGAGALSNLSNLTATARGTVTNDVPNTKVTFTAGSSGTRTWNVTNGTWEIVGPDNSWVEGDNKFFNGDSVVFNNPASPSTVTLSGNLLPASVDVTNSTNGYVFSGSGSIGGTSTFTKQGSGTLEIATTNSYIGATTIGAGTVTLSGALQNTEITVENGAVLNSTATGAISGSASLNIDGNVILAGANSYTGATTIYLNGTLLLGDGSTDGSITGSSSIINDGSLTFNRLTDLSSAIPIIGSGSVTKEGAGILTLTGNSSYSGGTTISAGTVRIGRINSFGLGTVDIGSGATVTNSASLSGAPGLANTFTGSGAFTAAAGSGLQVTLSGDWTAFTGTVSSSAGSGGDMVFNGAFSESGVSVTTSEDAAYVNNYNVNNTNGMIVQNLTGSTVIYKMGSYQSAVGSNLRNSGIATASVIFEIGNLGTDTTVAGTIGGGAQTVALTKVGAGTLTLEGLNTYTGDTTVTGGVLAITKDDVLNDISTLTLASAASLNLTHSGTDIVGTLIINGVTQEDGLYTFGTGKIQVGTSTPFQTWALSKGLDGTPGFENGPADDPDNDGATNLAEFAFNGNPLSGSDNGQIYVLTADSDDVGTDKELILTVAVRKTTPAFTAGAPATAPLTDDVNYSVHGSTDLASFSVTVTPVGFVDPGVALTDATNYEYRSFSLNGSNGLAGKGFLRAQAEAP